MLITVIRENVSFTSSLQPTLTSASTKVSLITHRASGGPPHFYCLYV